MAGQTVVHTLRVQSEERGGAQAAAALHKVAGEAMAASAAVEKYATKAQASLGAASAGLTKTQDQLGKSMLSSTKSIDRLQRAIDPVFRSLSNLEAAQRRVNAAIDAGSITAERGATIIAGFRTKYDQAAKAAAGANDNLKLTGHQVQNLGFQLNDVATMLASGASPFQVMATQSGQVVQALQMGPGGLGGSLRAIGAQIMGLAARITPMGLAISGGLAAAGAGMAYFTMRSSEAEKSLAANEAAAKSYTDALKDLRTAAGDAGKAAASIFDRETQLSPVAARAQLAKAVADQQAAIAAAAASAQSRTGPDAAGTLGGLANAFRLIGDSDFRRVFGELNGLTSALTRGEATATEYRDALAEIQLDPNTPDDLKEIADLLLEDAASAVEAEARIKALTGAIAEMGYAAAKAKVGDLLGDLDAMGPQLSQAQQIIRMNNQALLELGNLDPSKNSPRAIEGMARRIQDAAGAAYDELSRSAREAAADAEAALADIDAAPLTRQVNEITRSYQRQIEEAERANGAAETTAALQRQMQAEIAAATREAARAEEARRAGYQLDLAAVTAHTDAQRAGIEAQRAYNAAIAEGLGALEAAARAEEARTLATARAAEEARRSAADRMAGYQGQVDRAQFELTLIGKSAAEVARLTAEFQMLQAAKQATRESGGVTAEETQAIRDQADAVGGLTQRLAEAKLQQDILFERSLIGLSDQERAIRQRLNSSGIDPASASGEYLSGQQRLNDEMEKSRDLAEGFTRSLIEGLSSGEGALDSIINTFAKLGQQMAAAGLDKLMGQIFGTGPQQGAGGFAGAVQQLGRVAAQSSPALSRTSYTAPLMGVERSALPDLTENFTKLADVTGGVTKSFDKLVDFSDYAVAGAKRSDSFSGMTSQFRSALSQLLANGPQGLQVGSGYRSIERQAQLFANAVGKYGSEAAARRWVAPPGRSQHNTGNAADLYYNGRSLRHAPSSIVDMVHQLGGKFGLAFPLSNENWHVELAGARGGLSGAASVSSDVATGIISANRQIATGAVPGIDPWSGMRSITPGAVAPVQAAPQAAAGNFMQSPAAQGGMMAIGSFASGMQSGDPIGGALSGALAGFASPLGPIGAILGGAAGLLGGLFGKSKQKKEQEKQERRQAEQAWKQNYPQFLELSDTVERRETGPITKQLREIDSALEQYRDLAKKTKDGNLVAEVERAMAAALTYQDFLRDNLRRSLPKMTEDLGAGLGLETSFTKARDGVMQMADQYRAYLNDVAEAYKVPTEKKDQILAQYEASVAAANSVKNAASAASMQEQAQAVNSAFWSTFHAGKKVDNPLANLALIGDDAAYKAASDKSLGYLSGQMADAEKSREEALAEYYAEVADLQAQYEKAVGEATNAAITGLLKIVSGDVKEQSDVEKALDESRGAAMGLATALVDLGLTAEAAGERIEVALQKRLENLRDDFTRGLQDEIDSLDGKGYLADFRSLFEDLTSLTDDANLINVDTSLVDTFFKKQAQAIVDGAELTGEAFDDLILAFPKLSGVVSAFVDEAAEAAEKAERESKLSDMLATKLERAKSAQTEAENNLRRAYEEATGEIETQIDALENFQRSVRDFLADIRLDDNRSPLSGRDQLLEAQREFRDLQARALAGDEDAQAELVSTSQAYLDEARAYYATSADYFAAFYEVEAVLKQADVKAGQQISAAQAQLEQLKSQVSVLISIDEGVKSIPAAIAALQAAIGAVGNAQREVDGSRVYGLNPERNRLIDQGLQSLGFDYSGNYGLASDGSDPFYQWRAALPQDQRNEVERVINAYIDINRQAGGLIPGYVAGGIVGNGIFDRDSVVAKYAGGGHIGLAGGEMVVSARKVTPTTYPVLDHINRTGKVPGNDNAGLIAEVRDLKAQLRTLITVTGSGLHQNVQVSERGARAAETQAMAAQRKGAMGARAA